jgi:glucose/arabinose dehydrogenase/mono/diheme cytochrome c family protein
MTLARALLFVAFAAFAALAGPAIAQSPSPTEPGAAQLERGKAVYTHICWVCHQQNGQGLPGVFPPLAKSDFMLADTDRAIGILINGLTNEIVVNNTKYRGSMPPILLSDDEIADTLSYVRNSWSNAGGFVSASDVQMARAKHHYASYESLRASDTYAPIPRPPDGFEAREVVRMPDSPVRFASDGSGKTLYVLCADADIYRVEPEIGALRKIIAATNYIDSSRGDANSVGFCLDRQGRFYIVVNQRNESGRIVTNEVTIYRTSATRDGDPAEPVPWFKTAYPWGVGPFNHGVGCAALGPDGLLYVASGSRTDGGETGDDPRLWTGGEHELTSCLWRLDPAAASPRLEIYARGIRNAYGLCWDDQGRLFATENGPDANAPEELNRIEKGKHYGFPHTFADWTRKAYPYSPEAPRGAEFALPVANLGPDAGFAGQPVYTFDPHSSPAGIVFLGNEFPRSCRGTFWVARFGNLLRLDKDVGFDLLQIRVRSGSNGADTASVNRIMAPLARPLDLHISGGRVYLCEYSRGLDNRANSQFQPGRIIEFRPNVP